MEEFKKIPSFPGYKISRSGKVLHPEGRLVKWRERGGMRKVHITKKGKRYSKFLGKLVAETFIGNPQNKTFLIYKDGNRLNHHVDNLEWVTHQGNCLHATRTGLNKRTKKLGKKVIQYTLEGIEVAKYNSLHDAHKTTGINRSSISKVCHGYLRKTNGFVFKFEDGKDKHRSHYKAKKRRILAIPLGEEGPTFRFDSVSLAAEFIGTTPSNIYSICKGILPSSKGYTFEYIILD